MIKVIAFDLVGVLIGEKDIDLSTSEDKLERLFGDIYSDQDYINDALSIINDKDEIINTVKDIINKLYYVKDYDLFKKIKSIDSNIKIVIASNHVSYIKDFINSNMDTNNIDDIVISADINKAKPDKDFFEYILDKYNISSNELLFLDDSNRHIDGASNLGINTIKVDRGMDIYSEVIKYIS